MTSTLTPVEVQPDSGPPPGEPPRDRRTSLLVVPALLVFGLVVAVVIVLASGSDNAKTASTAKPAAATPAAAKTATPALGHAVGISLSEFKVIPNAAAAAAGKVTFTVTNSGAVKHEFVVIKTAKPAGSLLKGSEADETGNVGEIGGLAPGTTKKLTLNLKAGHYALICNIAGHYVAGQHTDFTVR